MRAPIRRLIDPMPDYNLSLDLVRCTEAAALAAARWVGRGDKNAADQAAVDAMRLFFNMVHMDGVVVIGEGEKDQAPMLYNGESIGTGNPPVGRRGGRPDRRNPPGVAGRGQRLIGGRRRRARRDVQPRAVRLHGKDRNRTRVRLQPSTSRRRSRRTSSRSPGSSGCW